MAHLRGIMVKLVTKSASFAKTNNPLYIGFVGKGGGREFPLTVKDSERKNPVLYVLGTIWAEILIEAEHPVDSTPNGVNDPERNRIELDQIDYVYIRKAGSLTSDGDDKFKLARVDVVLYGGFPISRSFTHDSEIHLSNETGQIVYLPEV